MPAQQRKKAIAIFCTSLDIGGEPITSTYYWEAYQDLFFALQAQGLDVYFATDNATYVGSGQFTVAYTTDHRLKNPSELQAVHNVTVDVVFERAESAPFAARDIAVVNPESLRLIANNKIAIYQQFAGLQPFSIIVRSPSELLLAVAKIAGDIIVVKEEEGYGGHAVYIGNKQEIFKQMPENTYPLLVQEFLDTSGGVPGQGRGVHDVRLEICGGEITSYYIRFAKPGSYHSNVHRGGRMKFLPVERVPDELRAAVKQIDTVFAPAPRFYAADFAHSTEGWKLIELNDYVGLARQKGGDDGSDESCKSLTRLVDYLAKVARQQYIPSTAAVAHT
jgi:glutathione synthase/RimK-type ligase-like ATP-grasp enzyme